MTIMCMYNISLKDELLSETRRSFDSKAAMDTWLQQQVEALLVAYNASQQAARSKARSVTHGTRKKIEITPGVARLRRNVSVARETEIESIDTLELTPRVQRFKRGNPWNVSDEELDRLRYEYLTEKYR